ncbi:MAG TPA: hypothetical protein VF480_09760 [Verrucomicrobiae bacterium]
MKKHVVKLSMLTLCAAAILAVPALSCAQDTTNAPAAAGQTPTAGKHNAMPSATLQFHGTLSAVDTNAMTLTVGKRTFNMTSETIITKDGKPAVLADGVAGKQVRGAYRKNEEGKLDAVTVRFGGSTGVKKKESAN